MTRGTGDVDDYRRMLGRVADGLDDEVPPAVEAAIGDVIDAATLRARPRPQSALAARAMTLTDDGVTVDGSPIPGTSIAGTDLFWGAEYGGRGRATTRQFPPFSSSGYFLTPALDATEADLTETIGAGVDAAFRPWGGGR